MRNKRWSDSGSSLRLDPHLRYQIIWALVIVVLIILCAGSVYLVGGDSTP